MKLKGTCLVLAVLSLLSGCQKSVEKSIATAEAYLAKQDQQSAVIELKNALSSEPANGLARYLLGKIYLERGQYTLAEKEFFHTIKSTYRAEDLFPLYAKSLYMQEKHQELHEWADSLKNQSETTEAALQAFKALAYFAQGDLESGKAATERAESLVPTNRYTLLAKAYLSLNQLDTNQALSEAASLLTAYPSFTDALLLQGQLAMASANYPLAVESYDQYVKLVTLDNSVKFRLADALIKSEKYEEAETYIVGLLKIAPEQPYLNQLNGIIQFRKENYELAKKAVDIAISKGSNASSARLIAGVSAYKLGNLEQAHNHLSAIYDKLPAGHPVKRLFIELQLKLGNKQEAFANLDSLPGISEQDIRLLTQASHELLMSGDVKKANKMLEKASDLNPQDPLEQSRMGMLKLSMDDLSGIVNLENALEQDAQIPEAKWALGMGYLRAKKIEKATELAEEWIQTEPENASGYALMGTIAQQMKDEAKAKSFFQKAINLEKNNIAAMNYFSNQAILREDFNQALNYEKSLAEARPDFIKGLFKYFALAHTHGDPQYAIRLNKEAFERNQEDVLYRLNYARVLVINKKPKQVVELLKDTVPSADLPNFYFKALADSYIELGWDSKTDETYKNWQSLQPFNKLAWLSAITFQDYRKNFFNALQTVFNARKYMPKDPQFIALEAHYLLLNKLVEKSQDAIDRMSPTLKSSNFVQDVQGRIFYAQGQFGKSIQLLEKVYADKPDSRTALLIANAYEYSKQNVKGLELLEEHLSSKPEDLDLRLRLAQKYLVGNVDKAIQHYRTALRYHPNNVMTLNNLAWQLFKQKQYDEALVYAQKAYKIAPDIPQVADTYDKISLYMQSARPVE